MIDRDFEIQGEMRPMPRLVIEIDEHSIMEGLAEWKRFFMDGGFVSIRSTNVKPKWVMINQSEEPIIFKNESNT